MFNSPTFGSVTMSEMLEKIHFYISENEQESYRIIVGTDSQAYNGTTVDFVTAVVVHKKGKGGIYFWKRITHKKSYVLRQRMYQEATMSLFTAESLVKAFDNYGISRYNLEIHVDIGPSGQTRDMINEIVGMIRGSGYEVKTKPDSYGASKVADRYT